MANAIYPAFKDWLCAAGAFDWVNDDVRIVLVDTGTYTYSSAHDFLDDITAGARIAVTGALGTKSVGAGGKLIAADPTINAVSGNSVEALVLYRHTGANDAARRLIAYIDTGVTGLPFTPNGGNVTLDLDQTNGIVQL